ncbi:MAG: tetratricopeptide repeat protein [Promethearchaeota archaeon]|jgi:tetratricopeptide (TPR) repeat protein|nr:MAG: tetratricopeptide repeat protein [Candidatus Lokiarchaeota archaeon]
MVATADNFERSKEFFDSGDILNTLESFNKVIENIDRSQTKRKKELILFLQSLLKHCQDNNLKSEEAMVLRALGRTHAKFREHAEGLKYSYQALKIQKKLGKKLDVAEGLEFLAEDLQISGNYDKCIESFNEAAEIYRELGKLRREKDIKKKISELKQFSKDIVEDEYFLHKFNIDKF